MKKRTISTLLLSPVFLVVAIYALLISPLGGPTVKLLANTFVSNLHIEEVKGSFADTLDIKGITWKDTQWDVKVAHTYADITWRCLFEPRVCVNELFIDNAQIKQLTPFPESEEAATSSDVTLPLPIEVGLLTLSNIDVSIPSMVIQIGELEVVNFKGNRALDIENIATKSLTLSILSKKGTSSGEETSTSKPTIPSSYSLSYTVPELPEIASPIPIKIGTLLLEDTAYEDGKSTQKIPLFSMLEASFKQSKIEANELLLVHEQGELKGQIKATLAEHFPFEIKLNVKGQVENREQQIAIEASGALDAVELSAQASGAITANTTLTANLLDETLPLAFSANWVEQAIPTVTDGILKSGSLTLNGVMGDYVLLGEGAAELPSIGNVPVALDVVLKKHNIYVNRANIKALEGSLINTGTLYLNDTIAWAGKTTLNDVSAKRIDPNAPNHLNGEVDSILQYSEAGGLHVSLRDMNLTGELQGKLLSVKGNAVYAGPSDLFVTNIDVKQQQNAIRAVAQVLNKRHLNADIYIDVPTISDLYPEVTGAIDGHVKAVGPWQNPSATGTIALSDILVSANLSAEAHNQGPVNGEITLQGAYTDHKVQIDINVPEHKVATTLAGAWQNNHWTGTVSETNIKLANMYWQLSNSFDVDIGTQPISAKVGQHCWTSRKEGELCVANVLYADDRASWDIKASSLPVGLWANELAPEVVSTPSEATLTLTTKGNYSPSDNIDATFNSSLSTAPWQLGASRPLSLMINAVETSGQLKQGELSLTSLISSEDIGEATLDFNTRPFDEKMPLNGRLTMQKLDVSPFKPLSPAIRELTGLLKGDVTLTGYVDDPSLSGELSITDGAIDIQDTPVTLANWNQTVLLDNKKAHLEGSFVLGGGEGSLVGQLDWSENPSAQFNLRGDAFEIRQPNVRLKVSPNINVDANQSKVDVSGNINIPWARIEIESLPESAVSPSKDVHLRGEPLKEDPLDIVHASVMVNIDKDKTQDVKLDAFGLTASLHGAIQVNTQPALVGYGDLQILNGRYNAYGQQLIIQTGEVQFNGPIDQPLLLVEAIRDPAKTDDDVIAGIRIDGATDSPSINLFSEPAMDQQGVLSYLLTGSGPNSGRQDPNYASLLLGFGLSNTKTLTGQVGNALGIDDFSLSTNEDRLSVTGQINERLSVEYNVDVGLSNNDANSTLRRRQLPPDLAMKYQLLPSLYLEAIQTTLEDQSEFALDLYYEFFLGDNRTSSKDDKDDANEEKPAQ